MIIFRVCPAALFMRLHFWNLSNATNSHIVHINLLDVAQYQMVEHIEIHQSSPLTELATSVQALAGVLIPSSKSLRSSSVISASL